MQGSKSKDLEQSKPKNVTVINGRELTPFRPEGFHCCHPGPNYAPIIGEDHFPDHQDVGNGAAASRSDRMKGSLGNHGLFQPESHSSPASIPLSKTAKEKYCSIC